MNKQDHSNETSKAPNNPKQALARLMEGNQRFTSGLRSVESLMAHKKMPDLAANGQKPFAVILTCSDSRSPVELIFDQGIGDLFVVRVAGNVVAPSLLASIEFAVANFGSPIILVLGHTLCGAVKATCEHVKNPANALPSANLEELVSRIRPAIESVQAEHGKDNPELVRLSTEQNVRRSINLILEQSKIVRDLVAGGKVDVQGAVLDISNGVVNPIK